MTEALPLTPRMQRTMERAAAIARANEQTAVGTEHVVLALLEDEHGIAGQAIRALGFAEALREKVVGIITSDGYKTPSRRLKRLGSADISER